MNGELRRILRGRSRVLVDEVAARLSSGSGPHYGQTDQRVLSERTRRLVEALISSTYRGADQLAEYVAGVARRRFSEGFELEELQRALRILEVVAWQIVVRESSARSLATNLATLNTAMGYARDELARVCQTYTVAAAS